MWEVSLSHGDRLRWLAARLALPATGLTAAVWTLGCECSSARTGNRTPQHSDAALDGGSDSEASVVDGRVAPVDAGHDAPEDGGADVDLGDVEASSPDADALAPAEPDASPEADAAVAPPDSDVPDAPVPVSLFCGDGVRGLDEECDDGNDDETDFCMSTCVTRDRLAVGPGGDGRREIAQGGHVVAASATGAALLFVDPEQSPTALGVTVFRPGGERAFGEAGLVVSEGKTPYLPVDAAVAALPDDRYAVAWTAVQGDGSGLGIVMRSVDGATGTMGATQIVNTSTAGAQQDVDAIWTGTELVVAWTDRAPSPSRPRVRYRRYNSSLSPLGSEQTLEPSRNNSSPALAAFDGGFAVAWIERDVGLRYFVRAGSNEWHIDDLIDTAGDPPRLVGLDASHLVLTAVSPEYFPDGGWEAPRLYGALLDTGAPGVTTSFAIEPTSEGFTEPTRQMQHVALAAYGGSAFVAWWTGSGFDVLGERLFLKELPWRPGEAGVGLDLSVPEIPLARDAIRHGYFQDHPALVSAPWTPRGALVAAWQDGAGTFGAEGRAPDVVAEVLPLPLSRGGGSRDE